MSAHSLRSVFAEVVKGTPLALDPVHAQMRHLNSLRRLPGAVLDVGYGLDRHIAEVKARNLTESQAWWRRTEERG